MHIHGARIPTAFSNDLTEGESQAKMTLRREHSRIKNSNNNNRFLGSSLLSSYFLAFIYLCHSTSRTQNLSRDHRFEQLFAPLKLKARSSCVTCALRDFPFSFSLLPVDRKMKNYKPLLTEHYLWTVVSRARQFGTIQPNRCSSAAKNTGPQKEAMTKKFSRFNFFPFPISAMPAFSRSALLLSFDPFRSCRRYGFPSNWK